jgi:hypothetical protein
LPAEGKLSSGAALDGPILSGTKPFAGGRGVYADWVNFEDTAYVADYYDHPDRLTEFAQPYKGGLVVPVAEPKHVSPLAAAIAAVARPTVKRASSITKKTTVAKKIAKPPAKKAKVEKPAMEKPAPVDDRTGTEKEMAAKKTAAEQISKTMDAYAQKVQDEKSAQLARVPESAKNVAGKDEAREEQMEKVGAEMADGDDAEANVKNLEKQATDDDF